MILEIYIRDNHIGEGECKKECNSLHWHLLVTNTKHINHNESFTQSNKAYIPYNNVKMALLGCK